MKNNYALSLLLLGLLSGCVGKTVPSADIYTLSPNWNELNALASKQSPTQQVIKLAPIRADRSLNGSEILYSGTEHNQNSYVYSRWNDSPVKLLHTVFQVAIEQCNLYKAAIPFTSIAQADLFLESTLLELTHHINTDGTSAGIIRIRFYLIDNTTKSILSTKEFVAQVPAPDKNAKGAVTALNKATAKIALDLVQWLAQTRPKAPQAQ